MKLLDELFEIIEVTATHSGFSFSIHLVPGHIVYAGHFPGHPVTPGVILLQIVHELIERQTGKSIQLRSMPDCKFLKIVNPEIDNKAILSIDLVYKENIIQVKASGKNKLGVFLKLNAFYQQDQSKLT